MSKVSQVTAKLSGAEDLMPEGQCWPWHRWTKWVDEGKVTKSAYGVTRDDGLIQARRCARCNLLQRRTEWAKADADH